MSDDSSFVRLPRNLSRAIALAASLSRRDFASILLQHACEQAIVLPSIYKRSVPEIFYCNLSHICEDRDVFRHDRHRVVPETARRALDWLIDANIFVPIKSYRDFYSFNLNYAAWFVPLEQIHGKGHRTRTLLFTEEQIKYIQGGKYITQAWRNKSRKALDVPPVLLSQEEEEVSSTLDTLSDAPTPRPEDGENDSNFPGSEQTYIAKKSGFKRSYTRMFTTKKVGPTIKHGSNEPSKVDFAPRYGGAKTTKRGSRYIGSRASKSYKSYKTLRQEEEKEREFAGEGGSGDVNLSLSQNTSDSPDTQKPAVAKDAPKALDPQSSRSRVFSRNATTGLGAEPDCAVQGLVQDRNPGEGPTAATDEVVRWAQEKCGVEWGRWVLQVCDRYPLAWIKAGLEECVVYTTEPKPPVYLNKTLARMKAEGRCSWVEAKTKSSKIKPFVSRADELEAKMRAAFGDDDE